MNGEKWIYLQRPSMIMTPKSGEVIVPESRYCVFILHSLVFIHTCLNACLAYGIVQSIFSCVICEHLFFLSLFMSVGFKELDDTFAMFRLTFNVICIF